MVSPIQKNVFLSIFVVILSISGRSFCLELDTKGSYNFLIAVDDIIGTEIVGNVTLYVENIKNLLQQFSTQLHSTTKGRFHINSVDILVPSGWEVSDPVQHVSSQEFTYKNADVQVSRLATYPYVEGRKLCGKPGNYLDLPWKLFDSRANQEFETPSKVLTSIWAQFRYGVFEENGYDGNFDFPYFHRSPSNEWMPTGCSSTPIQGEFRAVNGGSTICDSKSTEELNSTCRFFPGDGNTANTSLLHFHWLPSVTEFCTRETHDYLAPNRHNDLCQHKSVWEVIESTEDFKKVSIPAIDAPQ